jgi:hypothetical protein
MRVFSKRYTDEESQAFFWYNNIEEIQGALPFPVFDCGEDLLVGAPTPFWAQKGTWIVRFFGGDWGTVSAESFHDRFSAFPEEG